MKGGGVGSIIFFINLLPVKTIYKHVHNFIKLKQMKFNFFSLGKM